MSGTKEIPEVATTLILTCMDYRFITLTAEYMREQGLTNKYYQLILAGASLGAVSPKVPAWNAAFWEQTAIAANDLMKENFRRVIIIDHRKCGAYELLLGPDCCTTRHDETEAHKRHLLELGAEIGRKYPQVSIDLLLMDMNGEIESFG